jgi:hypothetical protein
MPAQIYFFLLAIHPQDEGPAGITPDVAGSGRVDVYHAVADSSTGVRQPIVAIVSSPSLIP